MWKSRTLNYRTVALWVPVLLSANVGHCQLNARGRPAKYLYTNLKSASAAGGNNSWLHTLQGSDLIREPDHAPWATSSSCSRRIRATQRSNRCTVETVPKVGPVSSSNVNERDDISQTAYFPSWTLSWTMLGFPLRHNVFSLLCDEEIICKFGKIDKWRIK